MMEEKEKEKDGGCVMERLTKMAGVKRAEGYEAVKGDLGEVIERLGRFEDVYEVVLGRREQAEREMERLRGEGKTKSVQFRELMVQKVSVENFINLFGVYGIE